MFSFTNLYRRGVILITLLVFSIFLSGYAFASEIHGKVNMNVVTASETGYIGFDNLVEHGGKIIPVQNLFAKGVIFYQQKTTSLDEGDVVFIVAY